jgi:hypothetical protein
MSLKRKLKTCLITGLFLSCSGLFSQTIAVPDTSCHDNPACIKDSLKFYKNLHRIASKTKITYLLYGAVFKDPPVGNTSAVDNVSSFQLPAFCPISSTDNYKWYQGRIIGSIHIVTLDPLGKLLDDTTILPGNFLIRAGNRVHVKSRLFVIRNKLLFEEGDVLDSLKLIESERIIRKSTGISTARVSPQCPGIDNDTIAILIVVRDLWSINGELGVSLSNNFLNASDNNFMGYSHLIHNRISYSLNDPNSLQSIGNYTISNIQNTFISANFYYTYSSLNKNIGLSLDRPFISPLTKWAGGINLNPVSTYWTYTINGITTNTPLLFRIEDVWIGRSFRIRKGKPHSYKDPRLVLSGRVYNINYITRPDFKYDPLLTHQNSTLYLGGIGFCSRSYYKDVNIYRFGRTEDVPEGRLISFTGGYQKSEFFSQYYYGVKLAAGNHIRHAFYLSEKIEYGTFIQNKLKGKGVLAAEINMLSDLLKYNGWSARLFSDFKYVIGFNRDPGEMININGTNGLYGFSSDVLSGTSKSVLNLALVVYSPFKILEFQFAGILFAGFGRLGKEPDTFKPSPVYQTFGLGLLIRNENLIISTIQLSLNYYPNIPGKSPNSFMFNPSSIPDIPFSEYYVGKPDVVAYQ